VEAKEKANDETEGEVEVVAHEFGPAGREAVAGVNAFLLMME